MIKKLLPAVVLPGCCLLLTLLMACSSESPREKYSFNTGWKFSLTAGEDAQFPAYDDSDWRPLDLPHDWSIEGEFSNEHPATVGGGALPGGVGWYRKTFTIEDAEKEKLFYIEFDGVYQNSQVWINGNYLGKRPYGYTSFRYELTPYLNYGNDTNNVLAVKVDNSKQPNSRWYSGSGIYRNVWLVATGKIAVDHWGSFVRSPVVNKDSALLSVRTRILNHGDNRADINLTTLVYGPGGNLLTSAIEKNIPAGDSLIIVKQELKITDPLLWSDTKPQLYRVVSEIRNGKILLDSYETLTGIRYFEFDSDRGFILNGEPVKIKGVCNHHDLGCLGAALNTRALERRLELLKEMGCNAIRTSHNPPSPELLDLCDRMGFIVMDEAFDMWKMKKTEYDYSLYWDKWHKKDLEDLVRRDRNHPSVFIWSIGNEILEQWDSTGMPIARELAGIVNELDGTRPVTAGCNDPGPHNYVIRSGALDLIGYNYHEEMFPDFPVDFPGEKFIATETTSALATRGSYDMPSDSVRRWPLRSDLPFNEGNDDLSCSSYDNCSTPWGSTHQETWSVIKKHDFLSGMFIWTGFDYLGEPTPYSWPARSSYFGILDLCGFPKDAYYFYKSEWTDEPVLHIFPHWNWTDGEEVDVWAYTNCNEVELFLNGRSLGVHRKDNYKLHLQWRVSFEPGILLAVGKKNGDEVLRMEIHTAGPASRIILTPDRHIVEAGGSDLSFITATVVDKNGIVVPHADNLITFTIEGDASIAGVDNGCQTSMESFKANSRKAFHGKCLLVLKAGNSKGSVRVTASSDTLEEASIEIRMQ
ncbi:MAG: beta-galactosidase GalB [Bacteroidales bacterium]|nr:beta-galactosidase GalB [Bacteroidales bacterium]